MHLYQCTPQGHITGHSQASSFIQARDWHQEVKKYPWKWSLLHFKSCFLVHRNKKCTFTFYKLISVRKLYAFITSLQAWPHDNDLIQDSLIIMPAVCGWALSCCVACDNHSLSLCKYPYLVYCLDRYSASTVHCMLR